MTSAAALSAALVFALPACTRNAGGGAGGAGASDTFRIAVYAEPKSLNPILATGSAENFLDSIAFDELVTLDDRQREVPDLASVVPTAQNGGISKDGTTVTYHLRKNVKWQDGAPFTSADVKFSWQAVMNPKNNVVERHGYDQVASVDTPDAYTVIFHLKHPFAPFVDTVFGESDEPYRIIPKHLLDKYPDINKVSFNDAPIGTGPFRVTRWIRGDRIEFVANENYFRGKPKLAKVVAQIVVEANTAAAMLRSHETDAILDLTASKYRDVRGKPGVKVYFAKAPSYDAVMVNLSRPPLNDIAVRQAVSSAIDRATMVRNLEYGTATLGKADLSDFYWAYDPSIKVFDYDPKRAAQLLDDDGWKLGANGIRTKNGTPLSLQLVYGQGSETARALATQVQANLRAVGIDTSPKSYLYSQLFATVAEGGIYNSGKFDLAIYSWISGADPDNSSQFMCNQFPPAGNNISRYCNPQVDAEQRIATTTFDRSVRKRAYSSIEQHIGTEIPGVFLFYVPRRYGLRENVQNFTPNGVSEGWNAMDWSVTP